MGRLAVYKFAYLLSIIFTLLILGLSVFAYFAGRIDPESNMFAAYIAFGKPILVIHSEEKSPVSRLKNLLTS